VFPLVDVGTTLPMRFGSIDAANHFRRRRVGRREPNRRLRRSSLRSIGELAMLHWSLVFLVVALIAAVFGFSGIAATSAGIARILFGIFLILFLISFVSQFLRGV